MKREREESQFNFWMDILFLFPKPEMIKSSLFFFLFAFQCLGWDWGVCVWILALNTNSQSREYWEFAVDTLNQGKG